MPISSFLLQSKVSVRFKKTIVAFLTVFATVLFFSPVVSAQTGCYTTQTWNKFLYKFTGNWSDATVTTAGTGIYIANSNYSRIEQYTITASPFALSYVRDWGGYGIADGKLNQPQGVTVDSSGNVYVVDTGNNRIQKFTSAGVHTATWGTAGSGNLQFNNPTGIATDNTYLYIVDTGNNRIQKITVNGVFTSAWGSLGSATSQFSSPKGILVYNDGVNTYIYVADTGNNRIMRFETDGSPTVLNSVWGSYGSGNGQFNQPQRLAMDSNYDLYITDTTGRVQKFNPIGTFLLTWSPTNGVSSITARGTAIYPIIPYTQISKYSTSGILDSSVTSEIQEPIDVALDLSNNFYFNNNHTLTIQKFSASFTPLAEWAGNTAFSNPMGIGVNTAGQTCVADTGNNMLQVFDSSATWLRDITPIPTIGALSGPKDVANEDTGKMYIADTGNNRVLKFYPDGNFIWAIGNPTPSLAPPGAGTPTPTPPAGSFYNPYGITVDPYNNIYIADTSHHRIQKYNANGEYQSMWGEYGSADGKPQPQLDSPQGMAIDTANNIYVADTGNNRIQRFNSTGGNQVCWGEYGSGDGQFNVPRNIAVDSVSRIYVSDISNKRIQIFGTPATFASVSITQTSGTNITENGIIDSYSVKLTTQPSANVAVTVTPDAQATPSSSLLTFTPYNWNVPQTVTVTAVHDYIEEGDHTSTISHTASSADTTYNAIAIGSVIANITDTDHAGVTFVEGGGSTAVNESGTTDTYTAVLDSKPTANVTITVSPDSQSTVSPTTLTFTTSNWNTPQTVTVTAVHDYVDEGAHTSTISHTAASSDAHYDGLAVDSITANITDTDTAGVTLNAASIDATEGGSAVTYTVVLNSKPTSSVTVALTPNAQVTAAPASLVFSDTTWNTPQTVTVNAVHDYLINGSRTVTITHSATSSDSNYSGISISAMDVNITDIDTVGIVLTQTDGDTSVTETANGSSKDTYTIALHSKPTATVTLNLTSTLEATTTASTYTFTTLNWNVPQTATVSAINDDVARGVHTAIVMHTATSADSDYNNFSAGLGVTVTDMSSLGIVLTAPNGAVNPVEAGADDLYLVKLSSKPLADVTITISGGTQSTVSPSTLTFTPVNWGANQIATVSATNDYLVEGPHTATVTHTASSSDPDYEGVTQDLTVNITDDDSTVPGVAVVQTGNGTEVSESGTTDTYTLALTSRPTANVRIRVLGDNWEATSTASIYTFTNSNWNTPQTVSVRANDDTRIDGGQTTIFIHIVTSTDAHYQAIAVDSVVVQVNDNDSAAPASAPVCGSTPPYDTPHLFQINTTANTATLYYTPIKDNISYYYIAYGYQPGDMRFGASYNFGSYDGVIDYTVNALDAGTQYYFMVRGGNGCATGKWSNSLSATTAASGSASTRIYYAPASSQPAYASGASGSGGGTSASIQFTRNLYPGSRGADVRALQQFLNANGYTVASSGPGSPGNETDLYGNLTTAAVRRFQEAHYVQILSPLGYSSGTGILGPSTRAYINSGGK